MSIVTIKNVANAAGVSLGTASMALNGKEGVNEETRRRVLEIAEELGYRPNQYARLLTSKKTHTVGLIVTDISNPFFGIIIKYIEQALEERGYELMLGISDGSLSKEKKCILKFIDLRVDGVLIVPSHKQSPDITHLLELQERQIPLCFITTYYEDMDASCVMTDLSDGSYQLTSYLLSTGHRRIVYIVGNRATPVSNLRVEGYLSAFRKAECELDPNWTVVDEATFEGGYHATGGLLSAPLPDAVLAMNDIMAMGVIKRFKEAGVRVPEDVSVAGYDDLIYASLLETPLTTVQQPVLQMCTRAVEILLQRMDSRASPTEKVLLRPRLIVRASTRDRSK